MPEDFPLANIVVVDTHGVVRLTVPTSDPTKVYIHDVVVNLN